MSWLISTPPFSSSGYHRHLLFQPHGPISILNTLCFMHFGDRMPPLHALTLCLCKFSSISCLHRSSLTLHFKAFKAFSFYNLHQGWLSSMKGTANETRWKQSIYPTAFPQFLIRNTLCVLLQSDQIWQLKYLWWANPHNLPWVTSSGGHELSRAGDKVMNSSLEKAIPYHSSESYALFVKQVYLAKGGEIWFFSLLDNCLWWWMRLEHAVLIVSVWCQGGKDDEG